MYVSLCLEILTSCKNSQYNFFCVILESGSLYNNKLIVYITAAYVMNNNYYDHYCTTRSG